MRSYHREDMRHLDDSERYRDYDYLADDAWVGPNEHAPHDVPHRSPPPWSATGEVRESAPSAFDPRAAGRGLHPEAPLPRPRRDPAARGEGRSRSGLLHGVIDTIFHPAQALRSAIFRGKGPKNWVRSDTRIHDDVCSALATDADIDASSIEVVVRDGEATQTGHVGSRRMRYRAEDVAADVLGVKDVHNRLRIARSG